LQSPAPAPHGVLAGRGVEPHAPFAQVAAKHSPGAVHWAPPVHWTQAAVPGSQYGVPPVQGAGAEYCPLGSQVRTAVPEQALVPGVQAQHAPAPLHAPPEHAVPWVTGSGAHTLLVHRATAHWPAGFVQSAAVLQPMHAPVC
jgi:hypothetical protein